MRLAIVMGQQRIRNIPKSFLSLLFGILLQGPFRKMLNWQRLEWKLNIFDLASFMSRRLTRQIPK
jgi:hypothetical protein